MLVDDSRLYDLLDRRVQVLQACFARHRFARHAHEYLVIGFIGKGTQSYSYRGSKHVTPTGDSFLVNPGESHTGESADGQPYNLYCLYPSVSLLDELARDLNSRRAPAFREAVVHDPFLRSRLAHAHQALYNRESKATCEGLVLDAIAWLIEKHGSTLASPTAGGRESDRIRLAKEFIDQHFAEDLSLSTLANVVSLSPYYFARSFEREVGLPPHAYLENVRIHKACELLDRGVSPMRVAMDVGYSDQPHFTHRFKRILGVTPGGYQRRFT